MLCLANGGFVMARDPKHMTGLTRGIYVILSQLAKHDPQRMLVQEKLRTCQEEAEVSEQTLKASMRQMMEEVTSCTIDADACIPCCRISSHVNGLKCPPPLSSIS